MSLPTCPHCGQSVLDDDVDECPFCEESLSAKPSAKPKKPVDKKPAQPAAKSPAEKPQPKKRPAKKQEAAESAEEPFAVDQAAMSNAVPLRPKPTKGRTYEVVCPMCETKGYTSPKAGGREVKCANPECLVPLFPCPEPPPKPVEEDPAPQGMSPVQLGVISLIALAAVGGGVWFFILKKDSPSQAPFQQPITDNNNGEQNPNPDVKPIITTPPVEPPPKPKVLDYEQLSQQALEAMLDTSRRPSGSGKVRPKALIPRWISLAYADRGDLENAQKELERLPKVGADMSHFRVMPWVNMAWKLRERGESAAAMEAATQALKFAQEVPESYHETWNEAISLSALLIALDRESEMEGLLERKFLARSSKAERTLWVELMAIWLDRSFDLEAMEHVRSLVPVQDPERAGVVWQLVLHGAEKKALDHAKAISDPKTRGETLVAWGDAMTAKAISQKQEANLAGLSDALKTLPANWSPVMTARVNARMGQRYARAGDSGKAGNFLTTATSALGSLAKKTPMALPDMKTIYNMKFPSTEFADASAVSAFEVARLQGTLKQSETAWQSVTQGLSILRSQAPVLSEVDRLANELRSQKFVVIADLQNAVPIEPNESEKAYRQYRSQVTSLLNRSEARIALQSALLERAVAWNLAPQIQQEVLKNPAGDSYWKSELPWIVMAANPDQAAELQAQLKTRNLQKPAGRALVENVQQWMKDNNRTELADKLGRSGEALSSDERTRWLFRLCSQGVRQQNTEKVLALIKEVFQQNQVLGEAAAEFLAAQAVNNNHEEGVLKVLENRDWPPTQKIAAYRGFIVGVAPKVEKQPAKEKK